ncbi:MAG: hypothetical protein QXZ02_07215 [Candidatus Bathyarchaeia archaeon]
MQVTLDKFCSSEEALLDLEKVTLKDVIQMLRDGSFDNYFDRSKILGICNILPKILGDTMDVNFALDVVALT